MAARAATRTRRFAAATGSYYTMICAPTRHASFELGGPEGHLHLLRPLPGQVGLPGVSLTRRADRRLPAESALPARNITIRPGPSPITMRSSSTSPGIHELSRRRSSTRRARWRRSASSIEVAPRHPRRRGLRPPALDRPRSARSISMRRHCSSATAPGQVRSAAAADATRPIAAGQRRLPARSTWSRISALPTTTGCRRS